jgi:hypothetical protein
MPLHIEHLTSRFEAASAPASMGPEELERLVEMVARRVEARLADAARLRAADEIRDRALPEGPGGVW